MGHNNNPIVPIFSIIYCQYQYLIVKKIEVLVWTINHGNNGGQLFTFNFKVGT